MRSVIRYDLNALASNLTLVRSLCAGAIVHPVMKSHGYGLAGVSSGGISLEILLSTFVRLGCHGFYFAHWEEIAELKSRAQGTSNRSCGDENAIALDAEFFSSLDFFALNGLANVADARACLEHGITPVINSLDSLRLWNDVTRASTEAAPYVLHVDTGMQRLGLSGADFSAFVASLFSCKSSKVLDMPSWIISHLSCADDQTSDYNEQQLRLFSEHRAFFCKAMVDARDGAGVLGRGALGCRFSLANSAGCFLGAGYHFDAVRAGASLYGLNPVSRAREASQVGISGFSADKLVPVVTISAAVVQLRTIDAGSSVGYARGWIASRCTRIGIVAFGYGDGYPTGEFLSSGVTMTACYRGEIVRVLGRVSMDLLALDFTDLSFTSSLGDMVTLLGKDNSFVVDGDCDEDNAGVGSFVSCEQLALQAGEINYNVLGRMSFCARATREVVPLSARYG